MREEDLRWPGPVSFAISLPRSGGFDLFKLSGAVAGGITPGIRRAYECTQRWLAVAEVNEVHRDDLIDNSRQLASGFLSLDLNCPLGAIKFVDNALKDGDEDDVLASGVL